jgi:hypothetical protein
MRQLLEMQLFSGSQAQYGQDGEDLFDGEDNLFGDQDALYAPEQEEAHIGDPAAAQGMDQAGADSLPAATETEEDELPDAGAAAEEEEAIPNPLQDKA